MSRDDASKVEPKEFVESLRKETEAYLASVMEAVNGAADGEWIEGSEERVRELSAEFRRRVFEQAVQERVDAAEAAFPPSGGDDRRPGQPAAPPEAAGEQGTPADARADGQRPG